jgi:hypothetical protein
MTYLLIANQLAVFMISLIEYETCLKSCPILFEIFLPHLKIRGGSYEKIMKS